MHNTENNKGYTLITTAMAVLIIVTIIISSIYPMLLNNAQETMNLNKSIHDYNRNNTGLERVHAHLFEDTEDMVEHTLKYEDIGLTYEIVPEPLNIFKITVTDTTNQTVLYFTITKGTTGETVTLSIESGH